MPFFKAFRKTRDSNSCSLKKNKTPPPLGQPVVRQTWGRPFAFCGPFPVIIAPALSVHHSLAILVIAFQSASSYTVVTTNGKENGSMAQAKNLYAKC